MMLTKEFILQHKEQIAAAMEIPLRCGGAHWDGQQFVYRFGGCLVPDSVVKQGSKAVWAYVQAEKGA